MVDGFGPKRVQALRESGLETAGDLLYHFPRRYLDRSHIVPLRDIGGYLNKTCTVTGTIEKFHVERGRKSRLRRCSRMGPAVSNSSGSPVFRCTGTC